MKEEKGEEEAEEEAEEEEGEEEKEEEEKEEEDSDIARQRQDRKTYQHIVKKFQKEEHKKNLTHGEA